MLDQSYLIYALHMFLRIAQNIEFQSVQQVKTGADTEFWIHQNCNVANLPIYHNLVPFLELVTYSGFDLVRYCF